MMKCMPCLPCDYCKFFREVTSDFIRFHNMDAQDFMRHTTLEEVEAELRRLSNES